MQEKSNFETLPTGKKHISFSEVKMWKECSYRHNLFHVKKIDFSKPSPVLEFGTAVHSACEDYLLTRAMKVEICMNALEEAWKKNEGQEGFTPSTLGASKADATQILTEVPAFLEQEFPDWEVVDAEHQLYEPVEGHPHAFKGFIDGVIKAKGKRGEDVYWILDWKTTQRGWFREKRSDDMVKAQLGLYKSFWGQKNPQVPFKNIRCGFVLLKKSAKPGDHCELFSVSLGEVPIKRSLKVVSNMISSVKKGVAIKNRDSCTYCEFKGTEHCT
jgi:PD-(D/E)XK nuclease superfamily